MPSIHSNTKRIIFAGVMIIIIKVSHFRLLDDYNNKPLYILPCHVVRYSNITKHLRSAHFFMRSHEWECRISLLVKYIWRKNWIITSETSEFVENNRKCLPSSSILLKLRASRNMPRVTAIFDRPQREGIPNLIQDRNVLRRRKEKDGGKPELKE